MKAPLATATAIAVGIIILVGYFLPIPALMPVRALLLDWAIILATMSGLIAIIAMLSSHWKKLSAPKGRDHYSLFLILSFIFVFGAGIYLGPDNPGFQKIITSIQLPIEAALMGVLTISLTVACIRIFHRRRNAMTIVFAISALVFILLATGMLSVESKFPLLRDIITALNTLPLAGARGILIGVALGSLTTGLRVLLGSDRPYSG
jgi:hypothetical protein